jgi:hypothetical protein
MKRFWSFLVGMIVVIFLTTAFSAAPKATEIVSDSSALVEVCSQGLAYVPPGTRVVTCQGKVMRVLGMTSSAGEKQGAQANVIRDCYCPKCCGGGCAVLVDCGGGDVCTLYLSCSD